MLFIFSRVDWLATRICKLFTCTTSLLYLFIFRKWRFFSFSIQKNESILPGTLMPRQTTQEQKCTTILAPSIALVQNYWLSIQYLRILRYVSFRGERQTKIPPTIAFILKRNSIFICNSNLARCPIFHLEILHGSYWGDWRIGRKKGETLCPINPFLQGSSVAISGVLYLRRQLRSGCPSPRSRVAAVSVTAPRPDLSGPAVQGLPAFALSWVPILVVLRSLFTPV